MSDEASFCAPVDLRRRVSHQNYLIWNKIVTERVNSAKKHLYNS